MSADNWTTCPRCEQDKIEAVNKKTAQLNDTYGKVSEVEYQRMQKMLENMMSNKVPATLRESYEISIDEGIFSVTYVASCRVCNFHYAYRYSESVL